MSFLTPAFLLLSALTIPIIVLYMLRLRRRSRLVSSTMLWRKLVRDREANAPWQKLRPNILLILQLIILLALVLALARPYFPSTTITNKSVVVLLDGSASMLATDIAPDRFTAAIRHVERIIGDLGGDSQMTLILVGRTPEILLTASSDRQLLRQALAGARAGPYEANWEAAFSLAAGAAQGFQDASVVVVSDGGLAGKLPPLAADIEYVPVGGQESNLAISALAPRESPGGTELFVEVTNFSPEDAAAILSVELDNSLFDSRRITVPGGDRTALTWDLPRDTGTIRARISDQHEDFLVLDDVAYAVNVQSNRGRVLLVSEGDRFLETALSLLPGFEVRKAAPAEPLLVEGQVQPENTGDYDLVIYEGAALPEQLPDAQLLIINPEFTGARAATNSGNAIDVSGVFSNTAVTRIMDDQILRFVDWANVNVLQAKNASFPGARILVEAEGGPLLLAGEIGGRRAVMLTFRLEESDLPLQIAFPVLIANITNWLSPGNLFSSNENIQPGDPVIIAQSPDSDAVVVEMPDGERWLAAATGESVLFDETESPGIYRVWVRDENGEHTGGTFAVNLFSESESTIRPADQIAVGQRIIASEKGENFGKRETWSWLALAAIVVLAVEWWVYHQGPAKPDLPLIEVIVKRLRKA